MGVLNIMKTKKEVAIFKTVLVNGQVGVDALLLVAKALKHVLEPVKDAIVVKILEILKIVINRTVLVVGQIGAVVRFLVVRVLKLAEELVKEITVSKTSKKAKIVTFNHV